MSEQQLRLERAPCPVCGAGESTPVLAVQDPLGLSAEPFGLVRCKTCSLVYTQPRPDAASLSLYYQDVYYSWRILFFTSKNLREQCI